MTDKAIWSTNRTRDYIKNVGDEEKFNALVDRGYDPEMLANANLDDVIDNDDYMWQSDTEEFDYEIVPMLNKQTRDGIILLVGDQLNKAVFAEDLKGGDIEPSVSDVEIIDQECQLVWCGTKFDSGEKVCSVMYAVPEDDRVDDFIVSCMHAAIDDMLDYEKAESVQEAVNKLKSDMSIDEINQFCDFTRVPEACPPIVAKGLTEDVSKIEEDHLTEAKTKNKEALIRELADIKPLFEEYGVEYFTSMPFTAYEDDPESVEYNYPEFFKAVKAFFKEMGLIDKDQINDGDVLDQNWYENFDSHDMDVVIRVCEKMIESERGSVQVEKVYPTVPEREDEPGDERDVEVTDTVEDERHYEESLEENLIIKQPDMKIYSMIKNVLKNNGLNRADADTVTGIIVDNLYAMSTRKIVDGRTVNKYESLEESSSAKDVEILPEASEFIDNQIPKVKKKINKSIEQLIEEGHNAKRPLVDYLRDDIYELRVKFRSDQFRILYFFFTKDNKIVLTHGLTKNMDKVPDKEIDKAIDIKNKYEGGSSSDR